MARERERRGRAAEREEAERQTRLIYIGVGAVLGVAALLILAGLYVTRYLPPRAHVLTVGDESFEAREIVDRGVYLTFFEGGVTSAEQIARETVDIILEEEALRRLGPELVEVVTDADIERAIQIDLGLIVDDPIPPVDGGTSTPEPTATAVPTAEASATTEATTEPTAEATVDAQEFADALTALLRNTGLERDEYEAIVEAGLYRDRLREYFTGEVGEAGPQIRLQRIRVSTQEAAADVIAELEGGADFADLADEQSVSEEDGDGGEIGWTVASLESDSVQTAIEGLAAGEWTEPLTSGTFYDIYRVAEVAEDRAYDAGLTSRFADARLQTWIDEAIVALEADEDLSEDEASWINDRVLAGVTSRLGS